MRQTYFLQPAYVLHSRPYRDTSLLIDFFTREHGLIGAVARGVRGAKSSLKGVLLPFAPMFISFSWKRELAVLTHAECNQSMHVLANKQLFSAFYLNELLMKLLQRHDAHPQLYDYYHQALGELSAQKNIEIPLRRFEKYLLSELGYGLNLDTEAHSGKKISPESFYQFLPQIGFFLALSKVDNDKNFSTESWRSGKDNVVQDKMINSSHSFSGKSLLALAADNFSEADVLVEIKRFLRIAIAELLGYRSLKSRDLFKTISHNERE